MRMLRLHQNGTPILINPNQIHVIFPILSEDSRSYIYFSCEEDEISVDEDMETIEELIESD